MNLVEKLQIELNIYLATSMLVIMTEARGWLVRGTACSRAPSAARSCCRVSPWSAAGRSAGTACSYTDNLSGSETL